MADYVERDCGTCGVTFTFENTRGKSRLYCSKRCWPKPVITKLCDVPGCTRKARTVGGAYCEAHYYQLWRGKPLTDVIEHSSGKVCRTCGKPTGTVSYCSKRCQARYWRGAGDKIPCINCGKPVETGKAVRKSCSDECEAERHKEYSRRAYARLMETEEGRNKVREREYRRKARKKAAFVEDVDRSVVFDRYGWDCHICLSPIPKDGKWPQPDFGTLDHVIPLAKGGMHSYENVRPAHLRCNIEKGAKILDAP